MQWDVPGLLTRCERLGSTFIAVLVPVVSSVSDVILRACVRGCSVICIMHMIRQTVLRNRLCSGITNSRVVRIVVDYDYHEEHKEQHAGGHAPDYVRQRGPEIGPERTPNSYEFHTEIRSTQGYLPRYVPIGESSEAITILTTQT